MPSAATILRKIMGLPEPEVKTGQSAAKPDKPPKAKRKPEPSAVPAQSDAVRTSNPWETAGLELARTHQQQTAVLVEDVPAAVPAGSPWPTHNERSGMRFAQKFGRGVLWALVVVAVATGVRSWFIPPKVHLPPPAPVKTAAPYPVAEAQATAAMFARTYLSWDEGTASVRAAELAALLPAGTDPTMGWDGHGHQDVLQVQAAGVTLGSQQQARVRVLALVRAAAATGAPTPAPQWIALEVPVVATAGQIEVTGEPGLVGVPAQGPTAPRLTVTESDSALGTTTQPIVDSFLKSYAAGNAAGTTGTATAPGATIPPLPTGFKYQGLTGWSIDTGTGDTRTGTARVSWTVAGATLEQTYRITLTRVSSASAQTWQVADVHGGQL